MRCLGASRVDRYQQQAQFQLCLPISQFMQPSGVDMVACACFCGSTINTSHGLVYLSSSHSSLLASSLPLSLSQDTHQEFLPSVSFSTSIIDHLTIDKTTKQQAPANWLSHLSHSIPLPPPRLICWRGPCRPACLLLGFPPGSTPARSCLTNNPWLSLLGTLI